jgi:hypothetical protein
MQLLAPVPEDLVATSVSAKHSNDEFQHMPVGDDSRVINKHRF